MATTTQKLRFKTFKASLLKFCLVAIPGLVLAGYVGWDGWHTLHLPQNQPPFIPDPVVIGLCYVRFAFCAVLLVLILGVLMSNVGKSVTITPEGLICRNGKWEMDLLWRDAMVTHSPPGKKSFRAITLSNGSKFYRIEEFFFPDYDLLARVVDKALQKERPMA
ncbi:MAG: hypothetical protein ACYCW6_04850 [Candidatus Xenobia bacterium]